MTIRLFIRPSISNFEMMQAGEVKTEIIKNYIFCQKYRFWGWINPKKTSVWVCVLRGGGDFSKMPSLFRVKRQWKISRNPLPGDLSKHCVTF